MIGPSIDPADVGLTGLLWLFLSYGYVLYYASNLIGEGSELLLLVPSLAGLVGGVVLPLLGAVPDGAIILFSGLGSLEDAQESLAVGVGALAGSTIMLLTVPLTLSVWAGRVDLVSSNKSSSSTSSSSNGHKSTVTACYRGRPKKLTATTAWDTWQHTGVAISEPIRSSVRVMMWTTASYILIQIPASSYLRHRSPDQVAQGEHWWAAAAWVVCIVGLVYYMMLQLKMSQQGEDRGKRMAVVRKLLQKGKMSLSGAVASHVRQAEQQQEEVDGTDGILTSTTTAEQQSLNAATHASYNGNNHNHNPRGPTPAVFQYLKEILADAFLTYDQDSNGLLDEKESYMFFRDFHESISEEEMNDLFQKFDADQSGTIDLDEFIGLAYALIKIQDAKERNHKNNNNNNQHQNNNGSINDDHHHEASNIAESAFAAADVEEEDMPEEFTSLPPDEQQAAIQKRAFSMLAVGTLLVVVFSDPMVDVMQEIAVRAHLSPFYVSFILAPLASNASEVLSSQYYAAKKTSKTITVSLSALAGAASMNNTFCLAIFMSLVFFRGLAWQYTAETVAILLVEFIVGLILVRTQALSTGEAVLIGLTFPLSIAVVAGLEAMGFD